MECKFELARELQTARKLKPCLFSENTRSPPPRPSPPGRGRCAGTLPKESLDGDRFQHGPMGLPLPGERAGVRASVSLTAFTALACERIRVREQLKLELHARNRRRDATAPRADFDAHR